MARLTEDVKLFIVQRLACFESLPAVVQSVKEEFGLDVTRQAIQAYDPSKSQAKNMSKKLKAIFEETRKKFLDDTSAIPISHKAVRLATLQRLVDNAERRGNAVLVSSLLEQAAKEVGDSYTNKQRVEHSGKLDLEQRTDDELKNMLASLTNDLARHKP